MKIESNFKYDLTSEERIILTNARDIIEYFKIHHNAHPFETESDSKADNIDFDNAIETLNYILGSDGHSKFIYSKTLDFTYGGMELHE